MLNLSLCTAPEMSTSESVGNVVIPRPCVPLGLPQLTVMALVLLAVRVSRIVIMPTVAH